MKSEAAVTTEKEENLNNEIIFRNIALRLVEAEKEAQEKIKNLNVDIKKGSLIQAIISNDEGKVSYIIAKVEHVNILDKNDWEKHTGLPLEKAILKTCIINFDESYEPEDIRVYDSNNKVSDYWSNGLLELVPLTTDEVNTTNAFKEIDKFLLKNVKSKSPSDYTLMYNSVLGYFNQNATFEFNDMINKVMDNYIPENGEMIIIKELKKKIYELPEKRSFDRQFEIIPTVIRKRKQKTYSVNQNIDLTIKDSIENLKDVIIGIIDDNQEKYIKIKVDEDIFTQFHFNK
ncbi:hypothetical protein [Clostridium algidicarnis]|uniref:hypothetical protein n=1 Tax=Clostridium algidicarnis TaxID=37659 RepID=UPI00162A35EF|nr:hypothetical protein [Clostridium algidicarnis]MBB6696235.1 hypothetical protein [Clostridium algidicarnis]